MLKYSSYDSSFFHKMKREEININDYKIICYRQKGNKNNKDYRMFYDDDLLIHFESKEELIQYINDKVVNGADSYPDVYYKGSNLLKDCKEGFAYHLSPVINRDRILKEGLKPIRSLEILSSDIYLDNHKSKEIPKNFYKSLSVYLHSSYYLSPFDSLAIDYDLYAVDISDLDWRIGSIALSGLCLSSCSILDNLDSDTEFNEKRARRDSLNYWRNCYSKEEYLNNSERVVKSDKKWGLDEILYCGFIDKSKIKLIGTYDRDEFLWHFNKDSIKDFVKEEYLNNYLNILKKINRNKNV